jgi:formamidopyrimidine-DNA glycosylase
VTRDSANDPRRFGSVWTGDPALHPLIAPSAQPLGATSPDGPACRLQAVDRIKPHIMNAHIVVARHIYGARRCSASTRHEPRASLARLEALVAAIRDVLTESIRDGGTTLRDFHNGEGQPGYFSQHLRVYDRAGQPCVECGTPLKQLVLGQRSSYYCPKCQR